MPMPHDPPPPPELAGSVLPVPFRRYVRLESCDPATHRARFYVLRWQHTLFGEVALVGNWGRIGTTGKVRTLASGATATAILDQVWRRRLQHRSALISWE